jgi:hypothetical protein
MLYNYPSLILEGLEWYYFSISLHKKDKFQDLPTMTLTHRINPVWAWPKAYRPALSQLGGRNSSYAASTIIGRISHIQ